jgi:excinuclease ABC subunit C
VPNVPSRTLIARTLRTTVEDCHGAGGVGLASYAGSVADPATYRPAPGTIPDAPGVYRFRDEFGRVIYVGKAKSLRARLSSYFQDLAHQHPRTQTMVTTAAGVEWTVVNNEVEALQLEYSWIKEYDPRFNVKYRDDKSYPWLAVTLNEEFPRVMVGRGSKRRGVRYFGPYSHAWAIRETVDLLLRVFPMRSCSDGVFKRSAQMGRPCLLGYIDKCSAPCVDRISAEDHREIAEDFCDFLAGQTTTYVKRLEKQMQAAAADLEYERAARLRDDIGALNRAMEKNAVVFGDGTDADVFALAEDPLEVAVQIFSVRGGRIRGQRGWVADKTDDADTEDLVERALLKLYDGEADDAIPREVLVPALPHNVDALAEWLCQRRGARVGIRVPRRGDKRSLLETVARNATQSLATHKTKRASDLTTRSRALEEIQRALGLDEAPLRIECFDVSNLQGTEVVASMVVFEDGLPRKSDYRRFTIRGVDGQNDVAAMEETITRRFRRMIEDQAALTEANDAGAAGAAGLVSPETGRPRRFAYRPGLVVVDGGRPQVAAAEQALAALGLVDIPVCGLAKRLEEVWLPDEEDPVILPRTSEGLYLLQRVRDEAHRFAITHHRGRRSKSMTRSALDEVPGLGEVRRKALLKRFGSLKRLRAASVEDVVEVPGFGPRLAQAVVDALATPDATPAPDRQTMPAVNTATGELLDEGTDEGREEVAAGE